MTDPRAQVEEVRAAERLSQAQIARILGVTQGHYSKVVTGRAPLTEKLRARMDDWLRTRGLVASTEAHVALRMQELAASIRRECIELMHLTDLVGGKS